MDSDAKQRSSMLQKILGAEVASVFEAEPHNALKDVRPAMPTPMLDLVMRDGSVESFSYAYLSRVRFDPKGRLRIYFGDDVAVIEGRNLFEMRQKVRLHKASEICEGIEAEEALKPESAPHVERIYLSTIQEEERQNDRGGDKSFNR